ncbi:MAG: response regulator transcription factor [Sporichthyaceae bacterium]|nr:response regulator transcription factor [Sporichthyaceae bacterium]
MIRVLIADDQALVRGGFGMILAAQPDMDVVGMAEDGAQAVALALELAPEIVLMDVRMPEMDGVEATRRILADPAVTTKVVMLTTFDLDEYVYAALVAGASGFLLKETRPEVLADAVRTVAGGEALLAPTVLRRLVDQHASAATPDDPERLSALTDREVEVLRLIGRGSSNREISQVLWVAEATVKTHVTRIFRKLGLRDRAQAVVLAYETGLVKAGDPA